MRTQHGAIMAPIRYARNAGQAMEKHWWNGLKCALVPFEAGGATTGGSPATLPYHAIDVGPKQNVATHDGGCVIRHDQRGATVRHISGPGMKFPTDTIPRVAPVTIFSHVLRRDTSNTQICIGNGYLGGGGWTFQYVYAANTRMGLTKWGVSDHPCTTLAAIPNDGKTEASVALAWDGTTARFMMNGAFENLTVSNQTTVANDIGYGCYANFTTGLQEMAVYCTYVWDRVLSDEMLHALRADPWRVVRPFSLERHWKLLDVVIPPAGFSAGAQVMGWVG